MLMDKLKEMTRRRKRAHTRLAGARSKVYRAFLDMEEAAFSDGELAKKHKELIAVGISVVIDCESCMQWHIEQAVQAGANEKEVLEAIEVGIEMGGGPATVSARFALEVMDSVFSR
ncbi:MAG: carboxymuconolactone decarboxylase family protein [Deltaproteobacteria bacterium]|nr:carboxymuconolactone decarboxylase family protein [Deltaproteobacteria bacterium]